MSNIFIGNSRLIIQIYCLMFRLHTVAREKEKSVKVYEQRRNETPQLTYDLNFWQLFKKIANF